MVKIFVEINLQICGSSGKENFSFFFFFFDLLTIATSDWRYNGRKLICGFNVNVFFFAVCYEMKCKYFMFLIGYVMKLKNIKKKWKRKLKQKF